MISLAVVGDDNDIIVRTLIGVDGYYREVLEDCRNVVHTTDSY